MRRSFWQSRNSPQNLRLLSQRSQPEQRQREWTMGWGGSGVCIPLIPKAGQRQGSTKGRHLWLTVCLPRESHCARHLSTRKKFTWCFCPISTSPYCPEVSTNDLLHISNTHSHTHLQACLGDRVLAQRAHEDLECEGKTTRKQRRMGCDLRLKVPVGIRWQVLKEEQPSPRWHHRQETDCRVNMSQFLLDAGSQMVVRGNSQTLRVFS